MISPWQANSRARSEKDAARRRVESAARAARVAQGAPTPHMSEAEVRERLYGRDTRTGRVAPLRYDWEEAVL